MNTCPACDRDLPAQLRPRNPRRWCSEACRVWAFRHPGEKRTGQACRRCGIAVDSRRTWCSTLCADIASGRRRDPAQLPPIKRLCSEPGCGKTARSRGMCKTHYNKANGYYAKDPERERARLRIKTHRRKDWARLTDITPEYEVGLRAKAKRCPLCKVKMTNQPYLPHSKELDHIIPRGVGGTHTIGNVRIICRACNLARPKDGSDYTGPVTLWAEVA